MTVRYAALTALRDVDLEVRRGGVTAIIGPSGSGKSTLLAAINRLTDLAAGCRVSGRVMVGDIDVHASDTDTVALRRRVGMIFQKPNPFPLSIRRNIELPLRDHGVRRRQDLQSIVERVLRDVGLWAEVCDRLDAPAQRLSGGQQQRLCIARALALQPEVLLLDEPCGALDPLASGVIEDLLVRLAGRYTLVVVTHDLAQARRIADRTALLWVRDGAGTLVESGPTQRVFDAPQREITRAYVNGLRA